LRNSSGERFAINVPTSGQPMSELPPGAVDAVIKDACEMRISLAALRAKPGSQLFLKVDVWSEGLPMGSLPGYGELELRQSAMAAYTF
jgi:hypothetical protein